MLRKSIQPALLLMSIFWLVPIQAGNTELEFIDELPNDKSWILIDTRVTKLCKKNSLKNALCLSADSLMTSSKRVPNLKDISWILGTLGLQGSEKVIVVGNSWLDRDFVAGVLHLSGQKNIRILTTPFSQLLSSEKRNHSAGTSRGLSRQTIYTVSPRDKKIVLRQELWALINSDKTLRILDARSDAEYWGQHIRGNRGGHIPGAEKWEMNSNLRDIETTPEAVTVMYAHDPVESIAFFTRHQGNSEQSIRVFIEGWRSWASDGSLPVDAESFNESS